MKCTLRMLLLLVPFIATAQDSAIIITPSMFDNSTNQLFIAATDGWIFHEDNDVSWARKDIDITGWKKLKPTELSTKYTDKSGKAEGWFRIKIKLDDSLGRKPFGIKLGSWAASDLYIDGNLITSAGNTGINGKPFKEYSPYDHPSYPANLKAGNEYIIAFHFVDYVSFIPPAHLKSEDAGLISLIRITGIKYNDLFLQGVKETSGYSLVWIIVSSVLSLLFWLLCIQNPLEKNLRLIAFGSTFLALGMFSQFSYQSVTGVSYSGYIIYNISYNFFIALTCLTTLLVLVKIFKRKVTAVLKVFLLIFFTGWITAFFLPQTTSIPLNFILVVALFAVFIYYIISSWKKLRGAQWAIVAGLLFSILSAMVYAVTAQFNVQTPSLFYLSVTGYSLSFPLSLLVYVAIRFKEILTDMQVNAKQVVQLSEEKKEQAIKQQKILQEEVARQTIELRTSLENLKSTQAQLIQSEKMASLGELTAGIAHEIQNPLNFVNNFSEVNKEMVDEATDEISKGNYDDAKNILNDIKDNSEKINHHGKRADAIVKGMLQHSRQSSGKKEPTDINDLCDEYLRLSYHGLRAKDKNFNSDFKTDFDETIGKINIVPQDIGRVLLNLFNNAFYAVNEKQKLMANSYQPTAEVKTRRIDNKIEITVSDNGNGISQNIIDKIFQPFFTTKPTGQGTGLGLSLAYDIITKEHNGTIKAESKEGEGSVFIIQLPITA